MRNRIHIFLLGYALLLMLATACKPNLESPDIDRAGLDFSKYVAVGNSITAGYADGALYYEGQQNSLAKMIAQQFQLAQSFDFKQPLVSESSVGMGAGGNARYELAISADCNGDIGLGPKPVASSGDLTIFATNIYGTQGPFNNMGVPGAKSITVPFAGYGNPGNGAGNYNPFFTRMASNPLTASMLGDAAAQNPTFFSFFIGSNDVLLYALAGGESDAVTPAAGTVGVGFTNSYLFAVDSLTSNGAKGVLATVPSITSIPHFTTIPYNGLTLTQTQVDQLDAAYSAVPAPYRPSFHAGAGNTFVVADAASPVGFRQIVAGEYILITALDSIKCLQYGTAVKIPDKFFLDATEVATINNAVTSYNATITAAASTYDLALVDVNAFLAEAETGIVYNGVTVNTTFVSGGAFSLDGVHLTPLGNAALANEFLKAINSHYGSSIPLLNVTQYRGVKFP